MQRPDMAEDERIANNAGRVKHEAEIDAVIASWCEQQDLDTVLQALEEARVPSGPIYSVADMFRDPHYKARGLFEDVTVGEGSLKIPAMVPKLSSTPGRTQWAGPEVGSFNQEIYGEWLGLDQTEIGRLKESGVI
jgi:crotonobetainyl-CoA:carnitine CoA-transferase CaiB-like acyl-CoA transferase